MIMKKFFAVLAAITVFVGVLGSIVWAGTVGNPIESNYSFGSGWGLSPEVEIINKKELRTDTVGVKDPEMEGNWGFLKISSKIGEQAELYGKIGVSDLKGNWKRLNGTKVKVEMDRGLALAAGGSADLWRSEGGDVALRLGSEIRWTEPGIDKVKVDEVSVDISEADFELWEWQVSLAVSKEFERLIPYIGIKYSDSDMKTKYTYGGTAYDIDAGNDNNIGAFAGFNYPVTDNFTVSLEGRFFDEEAVTIAFHWSGL